MITKKQREKLRPIIGYHYTKNVQKLLGERGVTNKKGKPYSNSMIRNVYNGLNANEDIEDAIFDICVQKLKEIERRNDMLGIDTDAEYN